MDVDTLTRLRLLGAHLDQLRLEHSADCFYDVLSGALLWKDEIPDLSMLPPGSFEVSPESSPY
jgi:hypothetical protein